MGYDGTKTGTILRNKAVFTRPKKKGQTIQSEASESDLVCCRAGLSMERPSL